MQLMYAIQDDHYEEITERLTSLCLAYEIKVVPQATEPMLTDGSVTARGKEAIMQYLDDLQEELKSWYYCGC